MRSAGRARSVYYKRLFSERDFSLYEERGNYEEQRKRIEEKRTRAIKEIFTDGGLPKVLHFADTVESPWRVGMSLGQFSPAGIDEALLPTMLGAGGKSEIQFLGGYVQGRFMSQSWSWVDNLALTGWTEIQKGEFFSLLPFTHKTWDRVKGSMKAEEEYWARANVVPYREEHIEYAIRKLIQFERPFEAIQCLSVGIYNKEPLNPELAAEVLLSVGNHKNSKGKIDSHEVVQIITQLQIDSKVSRETLSKIEWLYLPLLDPHSGGEPKTLEEELACKPEFFCEVIGTVFKSTKDDSNDDGTSDGRRKLAENAYSLLSNWKVVPGKADQGLNENRLKKWFNEVTRICLETGHSEIAQSIIGQVLIYCPADPDGFWIHRAAADLLNAPDAKHMRNGYQVALFNSRGVHHVDPEGKPEMALAKAYSDKAESAEKVGYSRLAETMRGISDSYKRDAERIKDGTYFEN